MDNINVVKVLESIHGLRIKCPNCDESFSPVKGRLFDIREQYPKYFLSILRNQEHGLAKELKSIQKSSTKTKEKIKQLSKSKLQIKNKKVTRPKEIQVITKKVNIGQIIEKILPATNKFKFETKDCRILLTPIDYISFSGLSNNGSVNNISFIEVKTGNASLQKSQRQVKEAINSGNIEMKVY